GHQGDVRRRRVREAAARLPLARPVRRRPCLPRRRPRRPGDPALPAAHLRAGALRRDGADPPPCADAGLDPHLRGTVHLILGCGGTDAPLDEYGTGTADGQRQAKVFTRANRPAPTSTPGVFARAGTDAVEDAIWSA